MKILYIHQYFKTPNEPGGTRSYWIARELVKRGNKVTMIASNSNISSSKVHKTIDGIDVIYVGVSYDQNMSIVDRAKSFFNFAIKSSKEAFRLKNIDIVIATSTPLTIGIPALLLKKFRRIPYVFEVRDLWPEVPIQMGGLKNPLIKKMAINLEKSIYRNAIHVVALSPGMQDGVNKYIPKSKTTMIPNMSKIEEFWPRPKNVKLLTSLGLHSDTFKIIHFGALGLANGASSIIESAKLLKHDPSVEFIFLGGGATEKELKNECKLHGLGNVFFLGRYPMKETSEIVNFCDVSIVSFKDLPILYTNSPNKLFDSLSAGKPIIVNSAGWTKTLVEENKCGYYVNPHIPSELVKRIKFLQAHPEVVESMGNNARLLAENVYDKSILCEQFADLIEEQNRVYI